MNIGDVRLDIVHAGPLALDGGAMFGVVPKVLWEKRIPADESNRIAMSMNVLLLRVADRTILLDTGAGDKEDEIFRRQYGLEPSGLIGGLARLGVKPEGVDTVVNTHLHFDHAGGNTVRDEEGRLAPAFPSATYLVQRREYEDALAAHERNRASYFPENYVPLFEQDRLRLLDGEVEIAPGIRTFPLPGHTLGLQGLFVESRGEHALYLTDCVPTRHHVPLAWIMGYDLQPVTTLETKKRVLPQAAREGWTVFFEHDREWPSGRIEEGQPGQFRAVPVAL